MENWVSYDFNSEVWTVTQRLDVYKQESFCDPTHVGGCPRIPCTITGKIVSATSWNKDEYCSLLVLFCFVFIFIYLSFRQNFRTFEHAELSAAVW